MDLYKKLLNSRKAFSLVEVAAVLLIIGILISAVFVADNMISKFRLKAAESLTTSSPINGIKDSALWLETSLETSIKDSEASTDTDITSWSDQHPSTNKVSIVAVGSGPKYSNTINRIHAVKFSGSTSNHLRISDASFLNGTDYTIFVLEKRQSSNSNNYFLGTTSTNANDSLALGYSADSTVIHAQGSNSYSSTVSSYSDSTDKPRLFTFSQSSSAGKKTYINGTLAAQDPSNTTRLSGITTLEIGKGYTGEIGELVIFTRAINNEERQFVEDYLGKKWTRTVNRNTVVSCVGLTITDSGCDLSASPCSINITGLIDSVAATSTFTPKDCNQTNYTGSINYKCVNAVAEISGACTPSAPCTSVSVAGISSAISAAHGASSTATCDVTGYDTSTTLSYTCSNGNITSSPSSCPCSSHYQGSTCSTCATGYTGSGCNTCDSAENYVSNGSGGCRLANSCASGGTIVGSSSTTSALAHGASATATCNSTGYDGGTITYSCSDGGITQGTCGCNTPSYSLVSGTCQPNCTFSSSNATTGITTSTTVSPTSSATQKFCNATNFSTSDSIYYTCSGGTISVTSGACDTCSAGYSYASSNCNTVAPLSCSGYTVVGSYKVHVLTSDTTLSCTGQTTGLRYFLIAGGGGGGTMSASWGGGGGGGGMGQESSASGVTFPGNTSEASSSSISITVGNGGSPGANGTDSSISGSTTLSVTVLGGMSGCSGPNSGTYVTNAYGGGKTSTTSCITYGSNSGDGYTSGGIKTGGGGGGSNAGSPGSSGSGGAGGGGLTNNYALSGTNTSYGGGGGGGGGCSSSSCSTTRNGGYGGGGGRGAGSTYAATSPGQRGAGGNGGSSNASTSTSHSASSGLGGTVVISYPNL